MQLTTAASVIVFHGVAQSYYAHNMMYTALCPHRKKKNRMGNFLNVKCIYYSA